MRTVVGSFVAVLLIGGCTAGSSPQEEPTPARSVATDLASLDLDWPSAGALDVAEPPAAAEGFDDQVVTRMAGILTDWAQATTADDKVWSDASPVDAVTAELPEQVGVTLRRQVEGVVSPRLAVANVFAEDVTVVGAPLVTTAWKVSTQTDETGDWYVLLELQTRAAYEVRVGDDAATRVIGVLRVHGLSAYADTTDDFGVSGGWQEFGASDCALAVDDDLTPAADPDEASEDLATFVRVGNGDSVTMPSLAAEQQVDSEYLLRCRNGAT